MRIASRSLIARLAVSATAVIAAALPVQGVTAVKSGQAAPHITQAIAGSLPASVGQRAAPLLQAQPHADSRFSTDAYHRWWP